MPEAGTRNGDGQVGGPGPSPFLLEALGPEFAVDPQSGESLHVGVGRPRALYVNYPTPQGPLLCRGAVMSYAQFVAEQPVTDEQWRERVRGGQGDLLPEWLCESPERVDN